MAIYVYRLSDGGLYSYSPDDTAPVADAVTLAANGLAVIAGLAPLDVTHVWDSLTHSVLVVAAAQPPQPMATGKWILRFTPQEFQAITASPDAAVEQFVFALGHTTEIDLSDPVIVNGVAYLASLALLTQARIAAVMAAP